MTHNNLKFLEVVTITWSQGNKTNIKTQYLATLWSLHNNGDYKSGSAYHEPGTLCILFTSLKAALGGKPYQTHFTDEDFGTQKGQKDLSKGISLVSDGAEFKPSFIGSNVWALSTVTHSLPSPWNA